MRCLEWVPDYARHGHRAKWPHEHAETLYVCDDCADAYFASTARGRASFPSHASDVRRGGIRSTVQHREAHYILILAISLDASRVAASMKHAASPSLS